MTQATYERDETKTITTRHAEIFVRQFGSGEKNLVFIHGGPGWDHTYFLPHVLPLAENFQLTFFDLRDCGLSKRRTNGIDCERSFVDACVDDLSNLLDFLQISRSVVLGFSFGGRVAMKIAESHPNKISGLILASTTAFADYRSDLENQKLYIERMTPQLRSDLAALWKSEPSLDGAQTRQIAMASASLNIFELSLLQSLKDTLEKIRFTDFWVSGYSAEKMKYDSNRDYSLSLKQSSLPILILHGEHDLVFPISCAHRLATVLRESNQNLCVIQKAGHLAHFEKPDEWNAPVRNFMFKYIE